jgi:hypothetical protein
MGMLTKSDISLLRNELSNRFDEVMVELRAIREEIAALTYRSIIHSDTLERHEELLGDLKRAVNLKKTV